MQRRDRPAHRRMSIAALLQSSSVLRNFRIQSGERSAIQDSTIRLRRSLGSLRAPCSFWKSAFHPILRSSEKVCEQQGEDLQACCSEVCVNGTCSHQRIQCARFYLQVLSSLRSGKGDAQPLLASGSVRSAVRAVQMDSEAPKDVTATRLGFIGEKDARRLEIWMASKRLSQKAVLMIYN